jgi:thioredoxin 1
MIEVKKFSAVWCGPCKMLAPIMEGMKPKFKNVNFVNIDVDQQFETASKYGIRSVPTVVIEKNGKEVKRFTGLQSAMAYESAINEYNK